MSHKAPRFKLLVTDFLGQDVLLCTVETEGLAQLIVMRLGDVYPNIRVVRL